MKEIGLDKMKIGQTGTITKVGGQGDLRCHLLDMGLIPKTKVKIVRFAPMGDPVEIMLRGYNLTLRLSDAHLILVEANE